jgi:uncharacterized metal-binding protein YceD (DUF177 family)
MPVTPEFSRPLRVDRIPAAGCEEEIVAEQPERDALARRFEVPSIPMLRARFSALPGRRGGVELKGVVEAEVERTCIVSLEPFIEIVAEEVKRYFLAATRPGPHAAVLAIDPLDDDSPDPVEGGAIDLGEIAAETLGLALDPYPRKPGATFEVETDSDADMARPFDVLARLKKN